MTESATAQDDPGRLSRQRGHLRLLLLAGLVGLPVSLAAFGFLVALHELTHLVWEALPRRLGFAAPPWWWPLPWLAVAGGLAGAAIRYLPGRGGHVPLDGLGTGTTPPSHAPGILLAALAGLPLGVVLGPEAPLIAAGTVLAVLLTRPLGVRTDTAEALIGVAGATAAVAAIFGSPLAAAVFIMEGIGLAGPKLARAILPCLLASGIGAVVFLGLGDWTGLEIASLGLPRLAGDTGLRLTDLLWTIPAAVAVAVAVRQVHRIGHWTAARAARRPLPVAVAAALVVGGCAAGYALVTGRSPAEVALSGQATLAPLATDPQAWPVTALIALLVFKAIGYGVSLGALRGGMIFPAVLLGAVVGTLLSHLPGYGALPALAAGMAAATAAILPLPVASSVLVILLLGPNGSGMAPVVLLAVVVAFTTEQLLSRRPDD